MANVRISHGMVDYVTLAMLMMFLKKHAMQIEQLRRTMGDAFVHPSRPLATAWTLAKLESNYTLTTYKATSPP